LAGGVKFYREDYKEADHYFSQLVEQHPNSPMASQAIELAIISKHMSTGGADYDGRKVAEARIMVDTALRNYPQLAAEKSGFFERQIGSITFQQAQKDFEIGEFYKRTGHPGSAYFYYEIVRRRYPGTKFADLATDRMNELRAEAAQSRIAPPSTFDAIKENVDRMFGKPKKPELEVEDAPAKVPPVDAPAAPPRSLPADLTPRN
jgi:outer membrane protein assembly factor BamD (BamD/ComL family)